MPMKVLTSFVAVASLSLIVAAHGDGLHAHHYHPRQAPTSSQAPSSQAPSSQALSSQAPSSSSPSSAHPVSSSGTVNGSVTVNGSLTAAPTSTPNITFTLLSTNPTAVPLASIVYNESSLPTQALPSTAVPGTVPTFLPGAPPLPNAANLISSHYPKMDVVPPTDSPEVQQWIQDVYNTGIVIPDIAPTNLGGCVNNTAAAADPTRCWWTCGGCVAPYDITECPTPLHWGLTYDDGPSFYTSKLIDYLDQQNLKSTFFSVGSRQLQFPTTAQAEYMGQHQLSVHTWSHPYLTTLTNDQIIAELGWTKKIMKDVLGVTPNSMRPPYGDIDNRVRAICIAMGLRPIIWTRISPTATFDTGDFNIASNTTTVQQVLENWDNILGNVSVIDTGFIVLEHDLFEQTVQIATGYILPDALAHQPPFTIEPVVSCLNMPLANAYIETNDNTTNPPVLLGTDVTRVIPSATGSAGSSGSSSSHGGASSADARFSVGFGLTFMTTVLTLLVGVFAVRF